MRLLLIDNSNTRTKFALSAPGQLGYDIQRIPTRELGPPLIEKLLALEFDGSVISSVVPEKAALLREGLAARPLHEISHESTLSIGIDYPRPDQIGADRLANAVAVHARIGAPAIVVDFGTAVTFDVVGGSGTQACYLGGVIAPGMASMTTSTRLPPSSPRSISPNRSPPSVNRPPRPCARVRSTVTVG